ncbi:ThuA domain-containing protein [Paenibacillus pinistramenti]|uniref:ThuA domain-containing protein n=1 Tax=Paenibacillus pinistramenti TaxID=1768003 RepID=UPI001108CAC8|nr:ThuA domain-containing protein [Paenibacillus pinistramenti]
MAVRTLLLGDNERAPYHPLHAVQETLEGILAPEFTVEASEDRGRLTADRLKQPDYGLCISYTDSWDTAPEPGEAAGLLQFVAGGGGLLVLHSGISLQASPELAQLIGGKFTGHPPYTALEFQPAEAEAGQPNAGQLSAGLPGFRMDEEPYRFELDLLAELQVLLTYRHEDRDWPAAWARRYGLGRVVFLMPGHHLPSFRNEIYQQWILRGACWAAGLL